MPNGIIRPLNIISRIPIIRAIQSLSQWENVLSTISENAQYLENAAYSKIMS